MEYVYPHRQGLSRTELWRRDEERERRDEDHGTAVGCRLPEGPLVRSSLLISITHLPGGREGKMMLDCLHEALKRGAALIHRMTKRGFYQEIGFS